MAQIFAEENYAHFRATRREKFHRHPDVFAAGKNIAQGNLKQASRSAADD